MKVALLTHQLLHAHPNTTGSTRQQYKLAQLLAEYGHDVYFLYSLRRIDNAPQVYNNISLRYCGKRVAGFGLFQTEAYYNSLSDIMPDIVYTRGRTNLVFIASSWAKKNGKTHIWATNGEDSCERWKYFFHLWKSEKALWKKLVLTAPFFLVDRRIHQGIKQAGKVINQTEFQKSRLMSNWHKTGVLLPSLTELEDLSDLGSKKKSVLWVANLRKGKQPEVFIKLAEELRTDGWIFYLIGSTEDQKLKQSLQSRAENLPHLKLIGGLNHAQVQEMFKEASMLINTSTPEADGLPNTFLEAWKHGVPVISLHINPNNWLTEYNIGECAEGSFERMKEMVTRLLEQKDTIATMQKSITSFISEYLNPIETREKYLKLFANT